MARFDLTDFEWSVIQPLLPTKVSGVPRAADLSLDRPHMRRRSRSSRVAMMAGMNQGSPV